MDTLKEQSVAQLAQRARDLLHACREHMGRHDMEAWHVCADEHAAIMEEMWERV